jgi:glycerol-3-phosphate dehydrogenase
MEISRWAGQGALGPGQRARDLARMAAERFDVVVVGGGVTGAGVALDAASRGLSVALLEMGDLAGGCSSRSGKVFHGGLRYLKQLNFSLVRQASHERNLMVERLCPHLTHPTPFLFPLSRPGLDRLTMGAGILLYDLLGGRRPTGMKGHRHLGKAGALRELPSLRAERICGAVEFHDVVFDDARHTMTVARTAARHGAAVGTQLEVIGMLMDGPAVVGVRARDRLGGGELEVRGRCVVNASGAWADLVQQLAGEAQIEVRPAKGIHVVVPRSCIQGSAALIAPTADSVLVIRPWWDHWLIGTTDTPWMHDRAAPVAAAPDVDYLLEQSSRWLSRPLRREDVVGVFAGVRPLVSGKGDSTAALSRDHAVLTGPPGLVTVTGGKYTTYRVMARDALDAALRAQGGAVPPCVTAETPLLGAEGWQDLRDRVDELGRASGLEPEAMARLVGRYGGLATELLELLRARPELARPLPGALRYMEAEAVHAASHEGALHLEDVLARRTHVAMEVPDRGLAAAPRVAELVGELLGWDGARRSREVSGYRATVEGDRAAEGQPDDARAHAARAARIARG